MVLNLLSGIAAKLSAAGVAAKAGVGLAVAAASVSGAAAVGVLPDAPLPASDPVEEVTTSDVSQLEDLSGEGDETIEPSEHDNFGDWVSGDASDPESRGVDGSTVSDAARTLGQQDRPAGAGSDGLTRAGETPAAGFLPETVPAGRSTADQYRPEVPVPVPPADTPVGAPEDTAGAPEDTPGTPEHTPGAPEETRGTPEETRSGAPADGRGRNR